ncbi:NADH-quinone oxidoreductase subunit C [Fodinisporobacter ferrooxydans]|uniref:NADH-quinone oxidoreductase n=1 Tax=Fodinisporobacter ferrooxydans TaxID=2901836 RepID=A0ABY4CUK9_9BACL|nr:NADH-quinone oxidoreductase subunit C [Alicyclobacillaceae bacterium MYW30-H2]
MADDRQNETPVTETPVTADTKEEAIPRKESNVEGKPVTEKAASEKPIVAKAVAEKKVVATPAKEAQADGKSEAKPARPAKAAAKEDAPPDPRRLEAQKVLDELRAKVEKEFGTGVLEEALLAKFRPTLVVKNDAWLDVVTYLKNEPSIALDYVECMAGTDYPAKGYIEVAVYVQSMTQNYYICVKARADRENPALPSLASVFQGVNWEEREIFDLLGVQFTGHPDLRRIMMPDDWKGHPLRKDYSVMD